MSHTIKSLIAPLLLLAAVPLIPVAVAQQNQAPPQPGATQPGTTGSGMMQRGGMGGPDNMMGRGMSGATRPTMDQCRGMMQGGSTEPSDAATNEMLARCRAMMQQPQAAPPTPEKKE